MMRAKEMWGDCLGNAKKIVDLKKEALEEDELVKVPVLKNMDTFSSIYELAETLAFLEILITSNPDLLSNSIAVIKRFD